MRRLLVATLAAAALCASPGGPAAARELGGTHEFSGEVVVPAGETWKVLPGAAIRFRGGKWTVRGRLLAEGTAERPIRIAGDDAYEGIDIRGGDGSVVANAVVSGGSRGAQVTNAAATFRAVRWERNGIGLDVGQYAAVKATECVFDAPSRVGLLVKRGGSAEISESRFAGAGKAGLYVFGAKGVSVTGCRFDNNAAGIQASTQGARVVVARCSFGANGTALLVERMAAPEISECEIAGNRIGLLFSRRAEGKVVGCRIAGNDDGVIVEFSSYPVFRGNLFRGNRRAAVRLRQQSSEWEDERGDADREAPAGAGGAPFGGPGGRGDFRPGRDGISPAPQAPGSPAETAPAGGPPGKKGKLTGTVDFRDNDWGELAREAEAGGNVSGIHDGFDEPTFVYKGKRYRMDRVLLR